MANSECISDWKQQILSDLQNDDEIISILGVTEDELEDDLRYKRFFPYLYVTQTQDEVKTYICVDIGIDKSNDVRFRSEIFVRPIITFRIIGHQDDMRITNIPTYKTRLDYLSELIDKKYESKGIAGQAIKIIEDYLLKKLI